MKFGFYLAMILVAAPSFAETVAGVTFLDDVAVKERPLSMSIWYPSTAQASVPIGGNPVFEGVLAAPNGQFPDTALPLVVVSHGGLRSATDSGAWLSSSIAAEGYIVAEVNAPRPANAAIALDEIWERPQDIHRAIDFMLADAIWGPRIDGREVSVAGFALGATAALTMAGAELDAARYMRSCAADNATKEPDCGWFAAQGVNLTDTQQDGLAGLARDARVSAVIAINPEYTVALGAIPEDVRALQISLGAPDSGSGEQINHIVVVPTATVFDGFAPCTAAGPDILLEEDGDASLCGVSTETRRAIHQEVSGAIISFLESSQE